MSGRGFSAGIQLPEKERWFFFAVKILMLDNYDSFTYNLVQALGSLGHQLEVFRHDQITAAEVLARRPDRVVVSPGPGRPRDAGVSLELFRRLGDTTWVLGVCLGLQCLAEACGGRVVHAPRPRHGKTSRVSHDGQGLHAGLPNPFTAMRYHSLAVEEKSLPPSLRVTARADDDGVIMGLAHARLKLVGVQYHPESFLTEHGRAVLENFLGLPD